MIRTFTGRAVDVFNPKPEMIDIEDIAYALAHTYRFGGHAPVTVAQHCVEMSWRAEDVKLLGDAQMWALMHDAAEAYLGDMPRPIKSRMPQFVATERRLLDVIAERFALGDMPDEVRELDREAVRSEWRRFMVGDEVGWKPRKAEYRFLTRFQYLHLRRSKQGVVLPISAMSFAGSVADRMSERRRGEHDEVDVEGRVVPVAEVGKGAEQET